MTAGTLEMVRPVTPAGSPDTRRIYERDFTAFSAWCEEQGVTALPARPEDVAGYLGERARTDKPATLARRVASIARAHEDAGHDSPTRSLLVRSFLKALRRTAGVAARRAAAVVPAEDDEQRAADRAQAAAGDIAAMVSATPADTVAGKRDRALLLLTFAASLRRGELAGLDRSQVEITPDGMTLRLPARGREPDGEAGGDATVFVPRASEAGDLCPVAALEAWLDAAGIADAPAGPVFRPVTLSGRVQARSMTGHAVAEIIKRAAAASGKDPRRFTVQSLRARPTLAEAAGPPVRLVGGEQDGVGGTADDPATAVAALVAPLESADEGVVVYDHEFRYLYVNARVEAMLGRSRAELIGRRAWDLFPAAKNTPMYRVLERAMRERTYIVHRYPSLLLQPAWLEVRCVPYGGRQSGGLMIFFRDVTAEVAEESRAGAGPNAELAAEAALALFVPVSGGAAGKVGDAAPAPEDVRALLDALPHIVWTTSPEGVIRSVNRRWYRYTGTVPDGKVPDHFAVIHPDDREHVATTARRGRAAGEAFDVRYRVRRADGAFRRHLARVVPIRSDDGTLLYWLGTATDVDEE
jgi:PAS domain S-box-containing protein